MVVTAFKRVAICMRAIVKLVVVVVGVVVVVCGVSGGS